MEPLQPNAGPPRTSIGSWARDTGWLLGANIAKTGGLLVILVVLARRTDPDTVGRYALALAVTTPIFVFAQLGLKGVYLTNARQFHFDRFVRLQLLAAAIATALSCVIAALSAPELLAIVALVALNKCVDTISDLVSGPLQRHGDTGRIFWGVAASSISATGAAIWVLWATGSLELTLFTLLVVSSASVAGAMWLPAWNLARAQEAITEAGGGLRAIARAGLPIGAGAALLALVGSLPQYFLSVHFGEESVAVFAIVFYTVAVADLFVSTLVQGWIPRAREALTHRDLAPHGFFRFLLRTAANWTLAMLPLSVLGLGLAWWLIPTVFGPEFALNWALAGPIGIAVIVLPLASFANIGVIVCNLYLHAISLSVASAATSFILCFWLIPTLGIAGAFWAITGASLARAALSLLLLYRHERSGPSVAA